MMDLKLNLFSFLFLISAVQPIILVTILFRKKDDRTANRIFSIILIFYSLTLFALTFETNTYLKLVLDRFPHLLGSMDSVLALFGPLHFLYAEILLRQRKIKWFDLLHFIPFVVKTLTLIPFFSASKIEKSAILDGINALEGIALNDSMLFYALFIVYLILILFRLKQLRNKEDSRVIASRFIQKVTVLTLAMLMLQVIVLIFWDQLGDLFIQQDYSVGIILSVFLFVVSYWSYQKNGITIAASILKPKKYSGSTLSEENADWIQQKLTTFLTEKKAYLKSDLTLQGLAKDINTLPNHLSQVTNQRFGKKFNELINQYRIDHFKEIISKPENKHLTLEGLAYNCGFNSKTTFNSAFKQFTGMTPKEYRKKYHDPSD